MLLNVVYFCSLSNSQLQVLFNQKKVLIAVIFNTNFCGTWPSNASKNGHLQADTLIRLVEYCYKKMKV
jgi:hypothetical protein